MKKILIPTDFSKASDKVISFALEAFNNEPCEFYFLHTYTYEVNGLDAISLLQERDDFFKKIDMNTFIKMVDQVSYFANKAPYSKHTFKLLCKNSGFAEGVKEAINKFGIDIILIGTGGKNSKTNKYVETKVNMLVKTIEKCPVMAVPFNGEAWASMGLEDIKMAS